MSGIRTRVSSLLWKRHFFAIGIVAAVLATSPTLLIAQHERSEPPTSGALPKPPAPLPNRLKELRDDLNVLVNDAALAGASLGVCVQMLSTGEYLYRHNEDKALLPASNMKLLTTAAALDHLGAAFTYTTAVFLDGTLRRNGVFVGNVIVRGAGDPTFSRYFHQNPQEIFERWTDVFDSLGIRTIRGSIVGDDTYFDDTYWAPGWAWDDLPFPYSAPINALAFNDNKTDIQVVPAAKIGDPPRYSFSPEQSDIIVLNEARTVAADSAESLVIRQNYLDNKVHLSGNVPQGDPPARRLTINTRKPAYTFLVALKEALERRSITVQADIVRLEKHDKPVQYSNLTPICFYTSPPLSEIIAIINKTSHNFCAEMLLKTLGKEVKGSGTFEAGTDVLRSFAAKIGIPPEATMVHDGSGLSRLNLLSAKHLTTLLGAVWRSRHRDVFLASLAQPGKDGTLRSRLKNTFAESNVFAKTGTLNGTSVLSGIIFSRDKEPISFAFVLNNATAPSSVARNVQDLFCMRLASFSKKL